MRLKGYINYIKRSLKVNNIPDIRKKQMIWEIPYFASQHPE